VSWV